VSDIRDTLFYLTTYFFFLHLKKNEMKKLLLQLTIIFFLIGCAPEKTMNRKINGTWILITISGKSLPDSLKETVKFSPEGRNGKNKLPHRNQLQINRFDRRLYHYEV